MSVELCGVCNEEVSIERACIAFLESEKEVTSYHLNCEEQIPCKPCEDCGKKRLICNECKE